MLLLPSSAVVSKAATRIQRALAGSISSTCSPTSYQAA